MRLAQAFGRWNTAAQKPAGELQYLAVKKQGSIVLVDIRQLCYVKGAGIYTELHLHNGKKELHDKSLDKLEQLLPGSFERIHRSYIVAIDQTDKIIVQEGSRYQLQLKSGELLPIGRSKYKSLKKKLI